MLGPFAIASRLTPTHQVSLPVLSRAACASMSTTTTTTRDRGDRCGLMEWAQRNELMENVFYTQRSRRVHHRVQSGLSNLCRDNAVCEPVSWVTAHRRSALLRAVVKTLCGRVRSAFSDNYDLWAVGCYAGTLSKTHQSALTSCQAERQFYRRYGMICRKSSLMAIV